MSTRNQNTCHLKGLSHWCATLEKILRHLFFPLGMGITLPLDNSFEETPPPPAYSRPRQRELDDGVGAGFRLVRVHKGYRKPG